MHNLLSLREEDGANLACASTPDIPFSKFKLGNGLTVIVHEDRTVPMVATNLRINVGSKDEPAGRSGFAHLFEHLMFKESANRRGNWFRTIETLGGSNVNGTTNSDRTNYYQTVPTGALDKLLWMESDRLGSLLTSIDADILADELSVVKNEKRQMEGAPYGGVAEAIVTLLYPNEHPYGHTTLGSFEDLDGVDLNAVADWFRSWYGASNAVLVLAGDISAEEARQKVERWFGDLPPGAPVRRATQWLPPRSPAQRLLLQDRAPQAHFYKVWSTPAIGDPDNVDLGIFAAVLAGSASSRLFVRLVENEKLCTRVKAGQHGRALCGEFSISAHLNPIADVAKVEAAVDDEIARLTADGPTDAELERAKRGARASFIQSIETLHGRAELLAANEMYFGVPDAHRFMIAATENATAERVATAGRRWLGDNALTLEVQPFGHHQVRSVSSTDRTVPPEVGPITLPKFPELSTVVLENGLTVRLARRANAATLALALLFDDGTVADPVGQDGLSALTIGLLNAGTRRHDKQALAIAFGDLAIHYGSSAGGDVSSIRMSMLPEVLPQGLDLLGELLLEPTYPEDELDLAKQRRLVGLAQSRASAGAAAGRACRTLIHGPDHAYSRSTGGIEESLAMIDRAALLKRHHSLISPSQATLCVVGDIGMDELVPAISKALGHWTAQAPKPSTDYGLFNPSLGRFLVEKPGEIQSVINVALASPLIDRRTVAFSIFNHIFGGSFESRLNKNLRERNGWTYGASSGASLGRAIGSFIISTSVQAEHTIDALREIELEIAGLISDRPITIEEMEAAKEAILVGMASGWATNADVVNSLIDRFTHQLPDDYYEGSGDRVRAVTLEDVHDIATALSDLSAYSWVIAGDPARIGDCSDFVRIDPMGKVIR